MKLLISFLVFVASFCLLTEAVHSQPRPQWRVLPNAPTDPGRHEDIFFVNPLIGWVVNSHGQIFKTADGGDTWQMQLNANTSFRSVGFADSLRGWAGTLGDSAILMYSTTNGGTTWSPVLNNLQSRPKGLCGIWVVDQSTVYGCGVFWGPPIVVKTTDGGASWISIDISPYASTLVDCYFYSQDSGFVVGGIGNFSSQTRPLVLFTSNGGVTWQARHVGTRVGEWCWKMSFPSMTIGYVSIEGSGDFLKTTDRGNTWAVMPFLPGENQQGIGFATETLGWIGGNGNPTYETTNGGTNWRQAGFGRNINRFRMLSDTLGYAVGQTVYKYSTDSTSVAIDNFAQTLPDGYSLSQNYPNPFNPSTKIRFKLALSQFVLLRVFDVNGREVATLVNEVKTPSLHEITFDAADRASGIYFYKLTTSDFSQTRAMLFLR